MNGHLICIGGDYTYKTNLVQKETLKFKELQKITNLKIWGDDDLEDFLRDYNKDVLYAYLKIIPKAYKSDIARLSLLHYFGGWYSDMGIQFETPIEAGAYETVLFWDMDNWIPGAIQTSIMFSTPKNEIFNEALNRCVYNVKTNTYGNTAWDVTGPTLVGNSYRYICPNTVKFGKTVPYTKNEVDRFFTMDDILVAYGKNLNKQSEINNGIRYNTLWAKKQIFESD